jgi:hypothetical protein
MILQTASVPHPAYLWFAGCGKGCQVTHIYLFLTLFVTQTVLKRLERNAIH